MPSPFSRLAAQVSRERETWIPVSTALRATTKMSLDTNWLIQGPNNVGQTATALEFLYEFNKRGHVVYFFDIDQAIFSHRISDLDASKIVIIRPQGPEEFISALHTLSKQEQDPIMIFDSLHLFREMEVWKLQYNLDKFLDHCYEIFKHPTIVVTERTDRPSTRPRWRQVLHLTYEEGWYVEGGKVGHTVALSSKEGAIKGYIDYNAGRFSKRYFEAVELVKAGKHPTTVFEYQGQQIRGLRQFVMNTDPIAG